MLLNSQTIFKEYHHFKNHQNSYLHRNKKKSRLIFMNSNNYVKKMINILNLKDIKNHNLCIYNNRK